MAGIDYESLAALSAVAREGGFEAAAKSLGVTQSAVSQRVKHLEDKFGVALIIRGRPSTPTPTGNRLIEHFEQVSLLQSELKEDLGEVAGSEGIPHPTVRVSVNNDSLATWFPRVVKRAKVELGLRLDISIDDQEFTEERLKTGEATSVISSHEVALPGFRSTLLGVLEYVAVAAPELYEMWFEKGVSRASVKGTDCLVWDRKDTIHNQWMKLVFGVDVPITAHSVPSFNGYLACCLNGTGWGLAPAEAARPHLESGALIDLSPGTLVRVPLYWHSSNRESATLSALEEIVTEVALRSLPRTPSTSS